MSFKLQRFRKCHSNTGGKMSNLFQSCHMARLMKRQDVQPLFQEGGGQGGGGGWEGMLQRTESPLR